MPNLTRGTTRPSSLRSKLFLVRQPAKSVRRSDHPDHTPVRLAIGVVAAIGVLGLVWLMGHLGYRLGFAPLVRVPDLEGDPGGGLATGTMMVVAIPRAIFQAGLRQPLWLMIAFAVIAIPAGGLGAARPRTPGGPRTKSSISAIASTGAVCAMLSGAAVIWWAGSAARLSLLRVMPLDGAGAKSWYTDLQIVAGLDTLAVVAAALWVVLVMRLPIQRWLRALAASACLFSLVVVTVAMSISGAASTQVGASRSVCLLGDAANAERLVLGTTPRHLVTLAADGLTLEVELRGMPETMVVQRQQSIVGFLEEEAGASR